MTNVHRGCPEACVCWAEISKMRENFTRKYQKILKRKLNTKKESKRDFEKKKTGKNF
jgi:hypothetical protein